MTLTGFLPRTTHLVWLTMSMLAPASLAAQRFEARPDGGLRWFKGNTHSHTIESDGDSAPDVVASWYKAHGYQFLVLSDHNVFTDPRRFESLVDSSFILIGGEELTSAFENRPVHVNGLNIPGVLAARTDSTLIGTIQRNVDAVREARGTPHINHPNFRWAFGARELLQIRNDPLLEIWNGHPLVHNEGGDESSGLEEIWDGLLSAGKRTYGIAVDDAHHFQGEFAANRSNPGRGWVVIRANRLDAFELTQNLERGLFYASTGVTVSGLDVTPTRIALEIAPDGDFKYTTSFIGDGGRVLARVGGRSPSFDLTAIDPGVTRLSYLRARVDDSGGRHAWVQPVFIER